MIKMKHIFTFLMMLILLSNVSMAQEAGKGMKEAKDAKTMMAKHDKNKDGKIFQCTMCTANVSDKAGECACGMKLKEVSVDKAVKTHLKAMHKSHGHKEVKMMKKDKKSCGDECKGACCTTKSEEPNSSKKGNN